VLRILTFSNLYPSDANPRHGIFVEQRLRQLTAAKPVEPFVVAPVPWVPFAASFGERYAQHLSTERESVRHGIPVVYPRYPHVPVIGMTLAPYLMAAAAGGVLARIHRERHAFQLIDAQYFYPDGVAAAMIAARLGVPFTVTARGSDLNFIAQYVGPRRMIRWAARRAAAVITVSAALKRTFDSLETGQSHVAVLRNGVDTHLFRPLARDAARATVGTPNELTLLAVANLRPEKGLDLAIEALALVPQARLLIVGSGPELARLQKLARARAVAERVSFRGAVPQEDLVHYYSAADVSLLCSTREGLPNVVLESIACGTPVVSADVGGAAEVVTRREVGALFTTRSAAEVARCVCEVLARGLAQTDVARHAAEFSWGSTVDRQFELFSSIVAQRV
jgi:teichuronic acid biosynthesis glycosyltransferase TuaC